MFHMYGDSCENLMEILAVVIIWSPISAVCGYSQAPTTTLLSHSKYLTLQHTAIHCHTLQLTATHCNSLQHTTTHCDTLRPRFNRLQHTATHCNTLQLTATRCYTLRPRFNTLQHTAAHCITLHHTATHCDRACKARDESSEGCNVCLVARMDDLWTCNGLPGFAHSDRRFLDPAIGCRQTPRWLVSNMLQCVAVCCSVLQCVAVCCNTKIICRQTPRELVSNMLQRVAVSC